MGYYTQYSIQAPIELIKELREESEGAKYALDEEGGTEEDTKWYSHEEDMKKFSKKYPEQLFILEGIGEGSDDVWKKYFKNGKMQTCIAEVVWNYEEFDESKME